MDYAMQLSDLLTRLTQQTRYSPLITPTLLLSWLRQAIRGFSAKTLWLDTWTIIVAKANTARYLLPSDHIVTGAVYYDGSRINWATSWDIQLVSPTVPTYYYEDEWSDEASSATEGEFATQYALMGELWPLQLGRGQSSHGRKTLTLASAPTADGSATELGQTTTDVGPTAVEVVSQNQIAFTLVPTDGNVWLLYKQVDTLPVATTDDVSWSDGLAVLYMCGATSLALATEDDEYDRYRSWLYGFIADSTGTLMRSMAINTRMR